MKIINILLLVCCIISFSGCMYFSFTGGKCANQESSSIDKINLNWEMNKLRDIASICGLSLEEADKMDMADLLTNINIRLSNIYRYNGNNLTDNDLEMLSEYLYGKTTLIKTIKDNDAFIKKINGKRILVLDDN